MNNGVVINFAAGSLTGSSAPQPAQGEDPYIDGQTYTVSIVSTSGGNFEALNTTDTATVTINDTIQTNWITLNDVTVFEDQPIVYTAQRNYASSDPFSVTLNNGVVINFAAGSLTGASAPQPAQGEDPYIDRQTYTVSIVSTSGGNFEALNTTDTATVTVNDTIQINWITLDDVTVFEDQPIVYTAQRDYASSDPFSVTLNNGVVINFAAGSLTGSSAPQPTQGEDPYIDGQTYTVSIVSTSGGNFEALNTTDTATVTINDTIQTNWITLNDVTVFEDQPIVYTAQRNYASSDPFSVTLNNGVVINFAAGSLTGSSAPQPAQGEDPYIDGQTYTVSIVSTSGGNFEALNTTDTATVTINDTIQTNFVTLDDVVVSENQPVVYTAHMNYASLTSFTITLSNNVQITFEPGQTTASSLPQPAQGDDVYQDGQTTEVSIDSYSGGNFEAVNITDKATVTVNDTTDPVTATLTATASTGEDGGSITYTVTLSGGPGSVNATAPMTFTLSNSQVITIAAGSSSGFVTVPVSRDDVYKETDAVTAAITTHTGGAEFESLVVNTDPVSTTITDDTDVVTATLTAGASILGPTGVTIPYTVTLNGGPGAFTPTNGDLTFTLTDGTVITIPQNGTSATVNVVYAYGTFTNPITNSIASASGQDEYEGLVTAGSTSVNANTVPTVTGSVSLTVSEAGLDLTQDASPTPADLPAGVVTGTNPSSRSETGQGTGITFNATGETINVSFDNPTGPNWVAPTVSGLASGYSIVWALVGSELVGTLWNTTTNTNLGASIYLALSNTTAIAGNSVAPMVTVTLTDQLQHSSGNGNITINGLRVIATDSSSDVVSASVNVTVVDDRPVSFQPEQAALPNAAGRTITGVLDGDGSFDNNIGADQTGSVRFLPFLNGLYSGMTSGGLPINYTVSANGLVLTAATAVGTVFTATLTPGATDSYTINMIGTVDGGSSSVTFDNNLSYNFVGGNTAWAGFRDTAVVGSRDLLLTPTGSSGTTIKGTANDAGIGGQSSGGGGNEIGLNEAIRLDYVIDLTGDGGGSGGSGYSDTASHNHAFTGHYTVNGASFRPVSATNTTVFRIEAFDDNNTNNVLGDGSRDSITAIAINFDGETEYVSRANGSPQTATVGSPGVGATDRTFTVTFTDMGGGKYAARISGADPTGVNFATYTADGYNSLEVHYISGETFAMGGFGTTAIQTGNPVPFSLPVEIVDADGDTSSSAIDVTLLPSGVGTTDHSASVGAQNILLTALAPNAIGSSAGDNINSVAGSTEVNYVAGGDGSDNISTYGGNDRVWGQGGGDNIYAGDGDDIVFGGAGIDAIYGGAGNDTLDGGADNDTIIGGAGIDTITGGHGLDTIKFDQLTLTGNHDIINNYNGTAGDANRDVLDISALVDAAFGPGNNNVNDFVRIIQGGTVGDDIANNDPNDFLVQVDVNGVTGGGSFQTVGVLNGYNTSGLQHVAIYMEGQEYQFQTPV